MANIQDINSGLLQSEKVVNDILNECNFLIYFCIIKLVPPRKSIAKVQVYDTDSKSEPQSWSPEKETAELLSKFAKKGI